MAARADWAERALRSAAVVRGAFSRSVRARGETTGGSGVQIEGRGVEHSGAVLLEELLLGRVCEE